MFWRYIKLFFFPLVLPIVIPMNIGIRPIIKPILVGFVLLLFIPFVQAQDSTLRLKKVIRGGLSPKSVVHSGDGLFFAQNMMYSHTVRVYNRDYELVKTISDKVKPKDFGIDTINGTLSGSPVEAAFSHSGKYAWVSNYNMSGDKFINPGCDDCYSNDFDDSYLYKINTETFAIEKIITVGSVPKYVAVSPDNKYVLVSNWSSGDVSIVDIEKSKEVKRVKAGRFPRGIVVDSKSKYAYVTIMGSIHILKIDLENFTTSQIKNVGSGPRHLCISSNDSLLYVSLNNEGKIAKINLLDESITKTICGGSPRSMIITPDDKFLYVVNYSINKMSKVDLEKFEVTEQHETKEHPIGITFDSENNEVWVACYSGSLMVYRDIFYPGGSEWYEIFNVKDQLASAFDYFGKMTDSFFASADTKNTLTAKAKIETTNSRPKEVKKPEEKLIAKKEIAVVTEKKKSPTIEKTKLVKETSTPATRPLSPVPNSTTIVSEGNIYIIVGSFKIESNASKLTSNLIAKGYSATTIKNKNGMTYAAVGGFKSEETANDTLQKIKSKEGMDAWIYKM